MWVFASLQGVDAGSIRHAFIHDLMNAPSGCFNRNTQSVSDPHLDSQARSSKI
jgi:hypothetical protein